ncbi:hypothetical protein [Pseudomonas sp. NA-150]|uniref:hypothetical protein n=1 Tax=Pseudomonas sp. NA-150 TaxID=3367525 RepID=UPI0037C745F0
MIKQPSDATGCGVAVIAMLRREKDFRSAMDLVEPNRDRWLRRGTDNMTIPQMKAALEELMPGFHVVSGRKMPSRVGLAAIYVETKNLFKHWIAFDGTRYFDPLSAAKGSTLRINRRVAGYVALYACCSEDPATCEGCS